MAAAVHSSIIPEKKSSSDNEEIALGLNIVAGKVTYKAVADAFALDYIPAADILY